MPLHVGEDLVSALFATILALLLAAAMINSYQSYSEKKQELEDFELALNTAEALIRKVLAVPERPGLISVSTERLENFSKILSSKGIEMRIEIHSISGELLYRENQPSQAWNSDFSRTSLSLPVALYRDSESIQLCELVVHIGR